MTTTIKSARLLIESRDNLVENEAKLRGLATLLRGKGASVEELGAVIISTCDDDDQLHREATETADYMSEIYTCLAEIESAMSTLRIAPTSPTPSRRSRASSSLQSPARSRRSSPSRSQRSSPIRSLSRFSSPSRSLPRTHVEDLSPERRNVDDKRDYAPPPTENDFYQPRSNLRLPKLQIEPYDGNPCTYQLYMDSFESSVNSNHRLSDIDKFLYLKGLLRGKALSAVQGLNLTAENYHDALQLLKSRFGDVKMLKAKFFDQILNMSPVSDSCGVEKLRKLYDCIETNVRNLKSLGVSSDSFAPVIIPTILSKIPSSIRISVSKVSQEVDWDFMKVLQNIHQELRAREQCNFMIVSGRGKPPDDEKRDRSGGARRREHHTSGSSLIGSQSNPKKVSPCVYCGVDTHKPWNCDKITDVEQRREILKVEGRCFNCLGKKCKSNSCRSPHRCFVCKEKHHSSIHPVPPKQEGEEDAESTCVGGNGSVVLLKTVIATVSGEVNETSARIIFDDCSQRTYITRVMSEKLGAKVIGSKKTVVNGICGSSTVVESEIVMFYVLTLSQEKIEITARVLDTICDPISQPPTRKTVSTYPHLHSIKFSDYHNGNKVEVDILIGGDYYYDFVNQSEEVRGPPGTPVAVRTSLGWTIGGPTRKSKNESTLSNLAICTLRASETEFRPKEDPEGTLGL